MLTYDTEANTYDNAESVVASSITAAQWARAEAVKALAATELGGKLAGLVAPSSEDVNDTLADKVNVLAEIILTGSGPAAGKD